MSGYVPHAGEQLHQSTIPKGNTHHDIRRCNAPRAQIDQTQHECRQCKGAQPQRCRVGELSPLDGPVCTGLELTTESGQARLLGVDVCERTISEASGGFGSLVLVMGHLAGDVVMIVVAVDSVVAGARGGVVLFVVIVVEMAGIVLLSGAYGGHYCGMKGGKELRRSERGRGDDIGNVAGQILLSPKDDWTRRKDNDDSRPLDVLDSGQSKIGYLQERAAGDADALYSCRSYGASIWGCGERPLPPVGWFTITNREVLVWGNKPWGHYTINRTWHMAVPERLASDGLPF